jgi:hypothetical protein
MKIFSSLLVLSAVALASCNKDKFTTIPQVTIKSIKPDVVVSGNVISMKGKFTDQEGDLDSALIVYKWYNGTTAVLSDTLVRQSFTDFELPPKTRQGDLSIDFEYNTNNTGLRPISPPNVRDTTGALGIILIDKAGNRSVYVESDRIRLIKP